MKVNEKILRILESNIFVAVLAVILIIYIILLIYALMPRSCRPPTSPARPSIEFAVQLTYNSVTFDVLNISPTDDRGCVSFFFYGIITRNKNRNEYWLGELLENNTGPVTLEDNGDKILSKGDKIIVKRGDIKSIEIVCMHPRYGRITIIALTGI
mgnify:CR=1 FL=1